MMLEKSHNMEKTFFASLILFLAILFSNPMVAQAGVHISIGLPPPIVFSAPPQVIVVPGTYIYAVPDIDADMYFYGGWWWRLWDGHWYRSHHYESGWAYYDRVPSFYGRIPPHWRESYRERHWEGHPWNSHPIPHHEVQNNWRTWKHDRHWERNSWNVEGYKPHTQSHHQHGSHGGR